MEFVFETCYDQKGLTAMARGLRKTLRKKKNRRSHIFGWIVVVLALLLSFNGGETGFVLTFRTVLTWAVVAVMIAALLFEDQMNGFFAGRRLLAGSEKVVTTFREDGYRSESVAGCTDWSYGTVQAVAETGNYFVFLLSKTHAQIYDKTHLTGGTEEEFRVFIAEKTGKPVENV